MPRAYLIQRRRKRQRVSDVTTLSHSDKAHSITAEMLDDDTNNVLKPILSNRLQSLPKVRKYTLWSPMTGKCYKQYFIAYIITSIALKCMTVYLSKRHVRNQNIKCQCLFN